MNQTSHRIVQLVTEYNNYYGLPKVSSKASGCKLQYNTMQYDRYDTLQYDTIRYDAIQYNTIQQNTVQYNTNFIDNPQRSFSGSS